MKRCFSGSMVACFLLVVGQVALGDVKIPAHFGDNMVLQRDMEVPIWGKADPGESVAVRLGKQSINTKAGDDGKWMIRESMSIEGNKVRLKFKHVDGGFILKDGTEPVGFAIAGEDRKFVWAKAEIEGAEVLVWNDDIKEPVAVRYAWADNPACNLYNKFYLPASPFRTDDWPPVPPIRP